MGWLLLLVPTIFVMWLLNVVFELLFRDNAPHVWEGIVGLLMVAFYLFLIVGVIRSCFG